MQSIQARLQTSLVTIAIFAVLLISLSPLLVQAQPQDPGPLQPSTDATALPVYNQGVDESIKEFLCTPSDNPLEQGTALYDCIGKLYRFSLTAGAVVLVFFIVVAGYLYITGGETGKGKAKGIILSALTGMGILLGSFALLNFINPSLVEIRTIQPPIFESKDLPSCEAIGFGSRCITSTGQVFSPTVISGQQIQGNGISCSLGDDRLGNVKARCSIDPRFQQAITAAAQKYSVDQALIKAIIQKESSWKEVITSWTGCCHGLMQVSTDTAASIGCQPGWQTDGVKNIDCGTKYLAKLMKDPAVNSSTKYIISAYNAGPGKKSQGPSSICSGLRVWECPFTNSAKTACQTNKNSYLQTRDYVVTVSRWYNEFKSCS